MKAYIFDEDDFAKLREIQNRLDSYYSMTIDERWRLAERLRLTLNRSTVVDAAALNDAGIVQVVGEP